MMNGMEKILMLGSAQWGWNVNRETAFGLLDAWLGAGHLHIDTATNYPINKNPADFRAAEKILLEYIQAHGLRNLAITTKIGSLDNMRTPDVNLAPSFILMMAGEYRRLFENNLHGIMVHWDNRSDPPAIRETLEALAQVEKDLGIRPGLSGIKYPESYLEANNELGLSFDIQLKHNVLQSDLGRYSPFFSGKGNRFFAYGINAGGMKLEGPYPAGSTYLARGGDPENEALRLNKIRERLPHWNTTAVRPPVRTMNHLGLIAAGFHPRLHGLVLGFSTLHQLHESLDFWRNLEVFDYSDVFADLSGPT